MKRFANVLFWAVLFAAAQPVFAQEKQAEKPKPEEKPKISVPVKVQLVFTEYDGDKKISSMPYNLIAVADERGGYTTTSLRTGVRIPIETDGKDQKTTYVDVGSNIDCGLKTEEDGRYHLNLIFDRSALYSSGSNDEKLEVTRPNGQPVIRQFRTSETFVLKDGQTIESVSSTDPLNGHVMRVSVTINVMK